MIDEAHHRGERSIELWLERFLGGTAYGAEQDFGITKRSLDGLHGIAVIDLERAELVGHRRRIRLERADMSTNQLAEALTDVPHGEHDMRGEFLDDHPQSHRIARQTPTVGERIDRHRYDGDLRARGARDRQIVLTERACGEVTDHRADRHTQHRRRHHLAQAQHHRRHGISRAGVLVVGRRWTFAERDGELGEQRTICLKRLMCPHAWRDSCDLIATEVVAGDVDDVWLGDVRQRREREPDTWINVCLGLTTGGGELGELLGCFPVQWTLTRQRTRQIAEHRKAREGVIGGVARSHNEDATTITSVIVAP